MPARCAAAAILAAAAVLTAADARGQNTYTCTWTITTSGDWSNSAYWTHRVPQSTDDALINNGGTVSITQAGETCADLYLGQGNLNISGNVGGTVLMTGGNLSVTGIEGIGEIGGGYNDAYTGSGSFTQSGGTNSVAASQSLFYIGTGVNSNGSYTLSGSGLLSTRTEFIGFQGTGSFSQSGGTNQISTALDVGNYNIGTYTLSGSGLLSAAAAAERIGGYSSGYGTFTQSGGTNTAGSLLLAMSAGESGTYDLNGGVLLLSSSGLTQGSGTASFNFGGGTLGATTAWSSSVAMTLTGSGGNSTIDTTGGSIGLSGILSGTGGLTKVGTGTLSLAASNSYNGLTSINAGTLSLVNSAALAGNGSITFGGGTLQFTASNTLANASQIINSASPIQVDTNGQSVTFAGSLQGSNSAGLTKLGSGTLTLTGSNSYAGTTLVSNGTLLLANTAALSGSTLDTSGGGSLSFGTLSSAAFGGLQGSGSLALNNTTLVAVSLSVGGNNASTSFSGVLSGSGSLTKLGSSTLTLSGSNSYASTLIDGMMTVVPAAADSCSPSRAARYPFSLSLRPRLSSFFSFSSSLRSCCSMAMAARPAPMCLRQSPASALPSKSPVTLPPSRSTILH